MDPAPTCFPLQLIIPEGWPPSSQSPSTSLILGGGNGSRTVLRGLGMSFFNLSISMESNRSCFKWTATSWLRFGAIHTFQLHSNLSTLFILSFSFFHSKFYLLWLNLTSIVSSTSSTFH
ncbi:hypothetical protein ACFX1R_009225 [Malus domestica]